MGKWFGTDGIRGTVGSIPMVPEFMLKLGRAAGSVIRGESREATIVIGRDTRASGAMLQEALDAGLMASGVHVIDLGVVPTPAVAWLVRHLNANAGVVISASHNPADQNGIKFFHHSGRKLPESQELEIEAAIDRIDSEHQTEMIHTALGHVHSGEIFQELYIRDLIAEHPKMNLDGFKILMDCSNGAASFIAPEVFARFGAEVIAIHSSPNGSNINKSSGSEHVRRSKQEMSLLIDHHQARFGLAFDGDADRVVFIDEKGGLIDGDHMIGMLARYFDQRGELLARSVVTTTMRNTGLIAFLEGAGIHLFETPVGDKYVTDQLFELAKDEGKIGKIGLGGEQAGHVLIIDEGHPTGDGIRTALFVIRALLETGTESLFEFAQEIGKTPQIIASAHLGSGPHLSRPQLDDLEANTRSLQGVLRVNFRYSGTEPLFRTMLESDASLTEVELAHIALKICRTAQQISGEPDAKVDILNVSSGGVIDLI